MLGDCAGPALDAGCAAGRFTLELAAKTGFAVGVDLSRPFVSLARQVARQGEMTFSAPLSGHLTTRFSFSLPAGLRQGTAEFVRADAMRLPFRGESFRTVASLNVVDKLPKPLLHLAEARRPLRRARQPLWWPTLFPGPKRWPSRQTGLAARRKPATSAAYIATLLGHEPQWSATVAGGVWWAIRDHANRYERIRSEVVVARRLAAQPSPSAASI